MKKFFVDVETTGLDFKVDSIIELSAIIEIDSIVKEKVQLFIKPATGIVMSEGASKINGITTEEASKRGESQFAAMNTLTAKLKKYINVYTGKDKFNLYAYNSPFDTHFLRQYWQDLGVDYFSRYFWVPSICIMRMAMEHLTILDERKNMKNFQLATVAEKLGISVDKDSLHTGMCDVTLAREIYKKIALNQE